MPADERATKATERCHAHPGTVAVARCTHCDRPVCIACGVPVRGTVVGAECLSAELGSPWTPPAPGGRSAMMVCGLGMIVALVATTLPWTRLGRWLGGWAWPFADDAPWSDVAAVASLAGCVLWAVARRREQIRGLAIALTAVGLLVALGGYLAIVSPPPFTRSWLGPYAAAPAGLLAAGAAALATHRARTMS
jgi:hypothetical protein